LNSVITESYLHTGVDEHVVGKNSQSNLSWWSCWHIQQP